MGQMNQVDQNISQIIEMKSTQPKVDAGEDFLEGVMHRLNQPAPLQQRISGYIHTHSTTILLLCVLAINSVSIGLGWRSYFSEKDLMSQQNSELVYFVDPGQYQVYTHIKE